MPRTPSMPQMKRPFPVATGCVEPLGMNATLAVRSGAATGVLPDLSRKENRKRFGPTTVCDETTYGTTVAAEGLGVGWPHAPPTTATRTRISRKRIGRSVSPAAGSRRRGSDGRAGEVDRGAFVRPGAVDVLVLLGAVIGVEIDATAPLRVPSPCCERGATAERSAFRGLDAAFHDAFHDL